MQMASRKRKATTSWPHEPYDTTRFTFEGAWKRYSQNIHSWNILPERNANLFVIEYDEFRQELIRQNWQKALTQHMDRHIDVALVKEFYSNLYDPEDKSPKQVWVRGKLIKFNAASLNAFLETPLVFQPEEQYTSYSLYSRARVCFKCWRSALEAPEEGLDGTSLDMECVIILQPRPYFSYVRFEYGQGEVSLWVGHENRYGCRLLYFRPDIIDGPVQLLSAWLSCIDYNFVHSQRSHIRFSNLWVPQSCH